MPPPAAAASRSRTGDLEGLDPLDGGQPQPPAPEKGRDDRDDLKERRKKRLKNTFLNTMYNTFVNIVFFLPKSSTHKIHSKCYKKTICKSSLLRTLVPFRPERIGFK
jgi:hypothetical protein